LSPAEVREVTELITPGPAQALAGLLGVPRADEELPLLWHWVYLLDRPRQDTLGPDVPFGGFGASGLGRENGIDAVREYTQTKAIWVELTGGTRDPFTLG